MPLVPVEQRFRVAVDGSGSATWELEEALSVTAVLDPHVVIINDSQGTIDVTLLATYNDGVITRTYSQSWSNLASSGVLALRPATSGVTPSGLLASILSADPDSGLSHQFTFNNDAVAAITVVVIVTGYYWDELSVPLNNFKTTAA